MQEYLLAIWELVWHAGVWLIPVAIGILGVLYVPAFRKLFILIAIIGAAGFIGFIAGVADEKRLWKAAEDKTLAAEVKARSDAVDTINKYPTPGVHYDKYDRDRAKDSLLSVASDHILGQKRHPANGKTSPHPQPGRP